MKNGRRIWLPGDEVEATVYDAFANSLEKTTIQSHSGQHASLRAYRDAKLRALPTDQAKRTTPQLGTPKKEPS